MVYKFNIYKCEFCSPTGCLDTRNNFRVWVVCSDLISVGCIIYRVDFTGGPARFKYPADFTGGSEGRLILLWNLKPSLLNPNSAVCSLIEGPKTASLTAFHCVRSKKTWGFLYFYLAEARKMENGDYKDVPENANERM